MLPVLGTAAGFAFLRCMTPILASTLLLACEDSSSLPEYELAGATMGTRFSVKLVAPPQDLDRGMLRAAIESELQSIESHTSTYLADSEISEFNSSPSTDWIGVSEELCDLVGGALAISRMTGGAFDVTAGPLVNLWGFGPEGMRLETPSRDEILAAQRRVGYEKLSADCSRPALRKIRADVYIDLSGYAKGYAVDRVARLLENNLIENFLVEIGGELRVRGHNAARDKWAVAVERPSSAERAVQSVIRLTDAGMATSGDYRNYFDAGGRRYSHLIDARVGYPVFHDLASVTVISDSTAFADAMATALFVLGPDEGYRRASRDGMAAYFLLRTDTGFEERMTSAFETIRHQ